ncbi:MAG TPA: hypothetical protein PL029_02205 [Bacteroidia bacterium]|nr:hypothetical protein [Bacteroidia bacterium]
MEKNVRLIYLGRIRKIRSAVRKANEILSDPEFYEQIKGYRKFNYTDLTPDEIASQMQENNHEIIVNVSFLSFFLPAYANSSNKIVLSFWNFSKDLPAAVNILIHETVNTIELMNNNNRGNKYYNERAAAPWIIGAIAEVMVK